MLHLFHSPGLETAPRGRPGDGDLVRERRLAARVARSITALDPCSFKDTFFHATRCYSGPGFRRRLRAFGLRLHREDINKTLGRSSPDRVREADLAASQVTTIGVNSYLWRAALETLSFAPMAQVDSNGGVMVTDWYTNPSSPNERVKVTATILDRDLRADALRVAASRQVMQGGQWVDAPVAAATVQKLEEIILTRARDLRRNAIAS